MDGARARRARCGRSRSASRSRCSSPPPTQRRMRFLSARRGRAGALAARTRLHRRVPAAGPVRAGGRRRATTAVPTDIAFASSNPRVARFVAARRGPATTGRDAGPRSSWTRSGHVVDDPRGVFCPLAAGATDVTGDRRRAGASPTPIQVDRTVASFGLAERDHASRRSRPARAASPSFTGRPAGRQAGRRGARDAGAAPRPAPAPIVPHAGAAARPAPDTTRRSPRRRAAADRRPSPWRRCRAPLRSR